MKTILSLAVIVLALFSGSLRASYYFEQNFENASFPPSGWSVSNTTGYNVVRTTYCSGYGIGTSSAVADFYDYSSGSFDLISSGFPASTLSDSLIFDHAYAPATAENDRLDIYTSTDNGSTWTLLISLLGGASGPLKTGNATYDLFVPTSSQWATKRYGLPAGTNKVKFSCVSAFGNNLYLDNIKIGTPYQIDHGVSGITEPRWGIKPGTVTPKAAVKNYGTSPVTFQVTMEINPGGYTSQQMVSSLAPGAMQTVSFNSYNFSAQGNYSIKVTTANATDMNYLNDTLSGNLIVTNNLRNEVLEFATGTWCQWCPCGEDEVHHLKTTYPNSVILAYHGAGSDPWRNFTGNSIMSSLGFAAYPSGIVDRRLGNNNGWGSFFFDGEYRYSQSPMAPVSITPTSVNYNQTTGALSVNLTASALTDLSGNYKVSYVLTEDNLVYPQTGNSWCPGSATWVHDWIVRTVINNPTGDAVNTGGTWTSGQQFNLTTSTTLDPTWIGLNCELHIFIFKDNGALNTSEIQQAITIPLGTTGISQTSVTIPEKFELSQNYPNPFNPTTNIKFSIPTGGNASLKVYDMVGKLVATYLDGYIDAGHYNAEIDAANFASGIYFYTLTTRDFVQTKKMNLIK